MAENDLSHAKIVKLDTEGAEVQLLSASDEVMRKSMVDFLICELNEPGLANMGHTQTDLLNCARDNGYQVYVPNADASLPRHIPIGCTIESRFVSNLLFSKFETIALYWPTLHVN